MSKPMTPRERMRDFLSGKSVDRIPNGLGGCETAGLHNLAYHRLKEAVDVQDPGNRICTFMTNAVFEPPVLEAVEGDVILLASRMCPSRLWGPRAPEEWKPLRIWGVDLQVPRKWDFGEDPDGTWWIQDRWAKRLCPPGSLYFDAPPGQAITASFDNIENPSPDDFNPRHDMSEKWLRRLEEDARWLYENTDYCIACGEMISDLQLRPGGTQSWWMRMVTEPEACHEFLGKAVDAALAQLEQLDQAIGKYCMILGIADDMGDSRGVTIGPDLWRTIYKPHYQRLFTEWRRITGMKVNLHCCGSVSDILDDLIECGVEIYNPVQTSGRDMSPSSLKARFGDRLIFYGGVFDSVSLRADTEPEVVYETVKANIRTFSSAGGYIFAGVHNLPGDTPASHIVAALEAYRDCRYDPACLRSSR